MKFIICTFFIFYSLLYSQLTCPSIKELKALVENGNDSVKESLNELDYIDSFQENSRYNFCKELQSNEGKKFFLYILKCSPKSISQPDFSVVYLYDLKRNIILDWKSCWFFKKYGSLQVKFFDINQDDTKEIVFYTEESGDELFIAAYKIKNDKFFPVIFENEEICLISFKKSVWKNKILIIPQINKAVYVNGKINKVPVLLKNISEEDILLKDFILKTEARVNYFLNSIPAIIHAKTGVVINFYLIRSNKEELNITFSLLKIE